MHAVLRHEQRALATISFVQGFLFLFFAKKENRRKLYKERIAGEQHREGGRKSYYPHLFSTEPKKVIIEENYKNIKGANSEFAPLIYQVTLSIT